MTERIVRRLAISYLEALRLDRGLTADEVCRRAQIDPLTLRRLEVCGARQPKASTLRALGDVYDVRPAKLADEILAFHRRYTSARESETLESEAAA